MRAQRRGGGRRGGRRTTGGVDSPGGEELGGLRDGEREERRDERVVHKARCCGGRPHLEAPLPSSPADRPRRSTLPAAEDANPPRGSNCEGRGGFWVCNLILTSASPTLLAVV